MEIGYKLIKALLGWVVLIRPYGSSRQNIDIVPFHKRKRIVVARFIVVVVGSRRIDIEGL